MWLKSCLLVSLLVIHVNAFYSTNHANLQFLSDYVNKIYNSKVGTCSCDIKSYVCVCNIINGQKGGVNVTTFAPMAAALLDSFRVDAAALDPPGSRRKRQMADTGIGYVEEEGDDLRIDQGDDQGVEVEYDDGQDDGQDDSLESEGESEAEDTPWIEAVPQEVLEDEEDVQMGQDNGTFGRATRDPNDDLIDCTFCDKRMGRISPKEVPIPNVNRNTTDCRELVTTFTLHLKQGKGTLISLRSDLFDIPSLQKLFVIIPGFSGESTDTDFERMTALLIRRYPTHVVGVLGVDYNEGGHWKKCDPIEKRSHCVYAIQAVNTIVNGRLLALILDNLANNEKIKAKDVHLIGFDLGAHMARVAGHWFSQLSGGREFASSRRVGRFTALNPTQFMFHSKKPLDFRGAADFVDVIHSSDTHIAFVNNATAGTDLLQGFISIPQPLGLVDFYPDGGIQQVGCRAAPTLCNHASALKYFIHSLDRTIQNREFISAPCSSYSRRLQCYKLLKDLKGFTMASSMGIKARVYCGRGKHFLSFDRRKYEIDARKKRQVDYVEYEGDDAGEVEVEVEEAGVEAGRRDGGQKDVVFPKLWQPSDEERARMEAEEEKMPQHEDHDDDDEEVNEDEEYKDRTAGNFDPRSNPSLQVYDYDVDPEGDDGIVANDEDTEDDDQPPKWSETESFYKEDPPKSSGGLINQASCGLFIGKFENTVSSLAAADVDQFPWQVAIRENQGRDFLCSGSIVNSRWILAAGSCVASRVNEWVFDVSYGTKSWTKKESNTFKRSNAFFPENFRFCHFGSNLAIIKLDKEIAGLPTSGYTSGVNSICIYAKRTGGKVGNGYDYYKSNQVATVAGWSGGRNVDLYFSRVALTPTYHCNRLSWDHRNEFCSGNGTFTDCQADPGSPVLTYSEGKGQPIKAYMVGVHSRVPEGSPACGSIAYPSINIRTDNFFTWMEATMTANA